ncbi:MAG: hypothetical protein K2P17_02850 [Helicobacteraceae bacterium]|nr:hypothetical protein [Helicobacteraceae bacterium]
MISLEFIPKEQSDIAKLRQFWEENTFFSHIVLIDNKQISNFSSSFLIEHLSEFCDILLSVNLDSRNLVDIERLSSKKISGIIFLRGSEAKFSEVLKIIKNTNLKRFYATNNVEKIKKYLDFGLDGVITQSFYSFSDFNNFSKNFKDVEKIIPSFLPFFSQKTLIKWQGGYAKTLGIEIPLNYHIGQNKEILTSLLESGNLHISMINTNFSNIKNLIS